MSFDNPLLQGNVSQADKMIISGWCISLDDPAARPAIWIEQQGATVITLLPNFPEPNLREALNLPAAMSAPIYAWRLWFPLAHGVQPDIPFSILFSETETPLANGKLITIPLLSGADPKALSELTESVLLIPSLDRINDMIRGNIKLMMPPDSVPPKLRFGKQVRSLRQDEVIKDPGFLGKSVAVVDVGVSKEQILDIEECCYRIGVDSDASDEAIRFGDNLRSIRIPKSIFDTGLLKAPLPDQRNIVRVSGPRATDTSYLIGGATTFYQLDELTNRYLGKRVVEFDRIVDWGVGCARVARHFWETAPRIGIPIPSETQILGVDIDEVNIDWCQSNMNGMGDYQLLPLDGFEIADESVDLLYGISVMTHLSEQHQRIWLDDIHRILKPGACALLTVHGEYVFYRDASALALPFVEKFGFFDGWPDAAIGAERDRYYRAAHHARSYLLDNWTTGFEILGIIPAANAFLQDFVVLKRI